MAFTIDALGSTLATLGVSQDDIDEIIGILKAQRRPTGAANTAAATANDSPIGRKRARRTHRDNDIDGSNGCRAEPSRASHLSPKTRGEPPPLET